MLEKTKKFDSGNRGSLSLNAGSVMAAAMRFVGVRGRIYRASTNESTYKPTIDGFVTLGAHITRLIHFPGTERSLQGK